MGLFSQLFGARAFVPQQHLPTDGWCQANGVMRMSLVWPWYVVADRESLIDSYGRDAGVTPSVELHAPRSDRDASMIVWSDPSGGATEVPPTWAKAVARLYQGPIQADSPISLGGQPGRMIRVANASQINWRIVIPRGTSVVQIEACAPAAHADAYWIQIESMLATWGWDG